MFAAIGRFSHDHRRWVLLFWLVVLIGGTVVGPRVFDRLGQLKASDGFESTQGWRLLADAQSYGSQVLVLVDGAPVTGPPVDRAVSSAAQQARGVDGVVKVVTAYDPLPPAVTAALVATDRRATIVQVDLAKGLPTAAADRALAGVRAAFDTVPAAAPGLRVRYGGEMLAGKDISTQVEKDLRVAEIVSLPVSLVVLVIVFAGVLAAAVPVAGALVALAGGLLALLGWSHVVELDSNALSVTSLLSLGLAIDYSLLLVSRFREERAHGHDVRTAVTRTSATAGRTIAFSGLTVAASLCGLFLFASGFYRVLAAAGLSVVLVALAAALTLSPALLGALGRRISAPSEPPSHDGFFAALARRVQRHPVVVVVVLLVAFLAAGAPFLGVRFGNSYVELLPKSAQSRQVAETVAQRFRSGEPVQLVARTDPATLQGWVGAARASVPEVIGAGPAQQLAEGVSTMDLAVVDGGVGAAAGRAEHAVRTLRAQAAPFELYVTGQAGLLADLKDEVRARAPRALGLVALATFVLLFLMTGSVLVPVKALLMNTLSLTATFGVLVLLFQQGHGADLLGFTAPGVIEVWLPVLIFAFAFGLSMDYEVFLLSRVKELHDAGHDNDEAVELGLQRSGRIITSAALVMIIVFVGFAIGQMLGVKQMGIGLMVAVAVDATLVRTMLVPATMTLLGEWNWWAPGPLRRFHARFGLHEHIDPTPVAPVSSGGERTSA